MRRLMLMLFLVNSALISSAPQAFAGDPCPINFTIYDLGTPPWLDRDEVLTGLESQQPWMGLRYSSSDKVGIEVHSTLPGGPAERAGLRQGDIITEMGGVKIQTREDADRRLDRAVAGEKLGLAVQRGGRKHALTLTLGRGDPFVQTILEHARGLDDCTSLRRKRGGVDLKAAHAGAFTKNRRFRCHDAHVRLKGVVSEGDVVIFRGQRRLLVSLVGWKTVCLQARSMDGAKLTAKNVLRMWRKLTKRYVADRHENP